MAQGRLPLLLAAAGTGGGIGGLGFQVLSELLRFRVEPVPSSPAYLCPSPDLGSPSSPALELPFPVDWTSVLIGVCCGLCLGPILDLLFLLRGWVRLVRVQVRVATRGTPLYRLLE